MITLCFLQSLLVWMVMPAGKNPSEVLITGTTAITSLLTFGPYGQPQPNIAIYK